MMALDLIQAWVKRRCKLIALSPAVVHFHEPPDSPVVSGGNTIAQCAMSSFKNGQFRPNFQAGGM
jgi:hypothetical protein